MSVLRGGHLLFGRRPSFRRTRHTERVIPNLPPIPAKRLALRLTPDALRQVRGGHPWVYDKAITSVSDDGAEPGALAVVFDADRAFAGIGLWDPSSPIRVRMLHHGKPAQVDETFWRSRVEQAVALRAPLDATDTTGRRLIHGENDGFGGIVVDRYDSTIVVKVYSIAWLPHLKAVLDALVAVVEPTRVVLRLGRLAAADPRASGLIDGMVVMGDEPDGPVLFTELGLTFEADVINGQKTGHFLDQRDNRQLVGSWAEGARVLDVFSCTGGFSVHAAAGGATMVHSVDLAAPAIDTAIRNMAHNADRTSGAQHITTVGDAFEVMADLGARQEIYDIVVVDPPSFASRASERDGAIRAYRKLTELALPLVRTGGVLLQASCSSRVTEDDLASTVHTAVRSQGRQVLDERRFGHALDHPISFAQGGYLKAISMRLG